MFVRFALRFACCRICVAFQLRPRANPVFQSGQSARQMCARVRVRRTRLVRVRCDIHRYGTYRNTRVFGRRRFAYVLQPTFGYILGFLIAAPVGGFVARGLKNDARLNVFRLLLGAFCSLAIVYTVGVFYMYLRFVSSFAIYRTFARRG